MSTSELYRHLMEMVSETNPVVLKGGVMAAAAALLQQEAANLKLRSLIERKDVGLLTAGGQFEAYERGHQEQADKLREGWDSRSTEQENAYNDKAKKAEVNKARAKYCRDLAELKD